MSLLTIYNRINRIHYLISLENTGTPERFAKKLQISRRQLYYDLKLLKDLNAEIKYCRGKETFYYESPFEFKL
jgi:predicted DNA-binding transcriptional regulator YafY